VTYHVWGVGSFSPDTTEKALEVENKRREILRSLPVGHPERRDLPPMKLDDVSRSRYWYKKHGIAPPPLGRKERSGVVPFKIPNNPPLCGEDWLKAHLKDHTPEEIGALAIEISCGERQMPPVKTSDKRGKVKTIMRRDNYGS